jgi:acetyl esterase
MPGRAQLPADHDIRALLDAVRASGAPPLHTLAVPLARDAADKRRAALPQHAPAVARCEDRSIPVPGGSTRARVYMHAAPADVAIVFFHGGGWALGDLESHDSICRALAVATRAAVVSVDYRRPPEHPYPAAFDDAMAVTRWVGDHLPDAGAAAGANLVVAGDSAGASLAAGVALAVRDTGTPSLAAQLLIYPVLDPACDSPSYFEYADGYVFGAQDMRWFWSLYLGEALDDPAPTAAPLRAVDLRDLAPAVVVTAELDPARDDGERYVERLRAAAVPVCHLRADGMIHGFLSFAGVVAAARPYYDEVGRALRATIGA